MPRATIPARLSKGELHARATIGPRPRPPRDIPRDNARPGAPRSRKSAEEIWKKLRRRQVIGHNRTRGRSRRASRRCFLGEVSSRAVRVYYRSYRGPTSRCARYAERGLSRGRHAYEIFPSLMDHTGLRFPPLRPSSYPKFPRKRRLLAERIGRSSLARSTSTLLVQYIASRSRVLSPYSYTARASASRPLVRSPLREGEATGKIAGPFFFASGGKGKQE